MAPSEQKVGVFTIDREMRVTSWDAWLAEATGVPVATALGRPLDVLFPDLGLRGLLPRLRRVLDEGLVEVLSPALHHYLIRCALRAPSQHFDTMQQYVTIAPLRNEAGVVGALATVEDVTERLELERELSVKLTDPDEAVRLAAAKALASGAAELSDEASVGLLTQALGDRSWRLRREAASALARHGGAEAIVVLLSLLREQHHSPSVLSSALHALTLTGADVLAPLTECLRAPDVDLRLYAALVLGERRDRAAAPALLAALDDPDANVRYHAIEALGKLAAPEAADALLAIAESGDFFLAFPALDALARLGDVRVVPRLALLLDDELLSGPAAESYSEFAAFSDSGVAAWKSLISVAVWFW